MEHKDKKAGKTKAINDFESEEKLVPCTKAPSAEHSRSHDEDEPCDDGRTGKTDKK
jgi:hypothetical protein